MNKHIKNNQRGFTIVELIIATSIFSAVLLLATTGIVTMGKHYFKGITTSKTQEAVRSIEDEITNSIQVNGQSTISHYVNNPVTGTDRNSDNYYQARAVCVGDVRYTYVLNSPLASDSGHNDATSQHALWMDIKKSGAACVPVNLKQAIPSDATTTDVAASATEAKEMLLNNMRLASFDITNDTTPTLYKVQIKVIYGDTSVINLSQDGGGNDTSNCKSIRDGGQFCATADLTTFVKRRL